MKKRYELTHIERHTGAYIIKYVDIKTGALYRQRYMGIYSKREFIQTLRESGIICPKSIINNM